MTLSELIEKLENLDVDEDDPDVYISVGIFQEPIWRVEYNPETIDNRSSVLIVKRPLWSGYWAWEDGTIMMHCRDGQVIDIRQTDNVAYTFDNVASRDWMVVEE